MKAYRKTDFGALRERCTDKPHGTRARYVAGCKCVPCRAANSRYNTEREAAKKAGDYRGIVSADRARRHLLKLSKQGVGYKAVADACGSSHTIVGNVAWGYRKQIRASTERAILSVDAQALADGARVPAGPTWRIINTLVAEGYSKAQLARWLGHKVPALQMRRDWVIARTASKVERLARLIEAGKMQRPERVARKMEATA